MREEDVDVRTFPNKSETLFRKSPIEIRSQLRPTPNELYSEGNYLQPDLIYKGVRRTTRE